MPLKEHSNRPFFHKDAYSYNGLRVSLAITGENTIFLEGINLNIGESINFDSINEQNATIHQGDRGSISAWKIGEEGSVHSAPNPPSVEGNPRVVIFITCDDDHINSLANEKTVSSIGEINSSELIDFYL